MSSVIKIDRSALNKNLTFLVIEDMPTLRMQLVNDLRSIGILGEILEASTLQEALEFMETDTIEFVIADWKLPDGTGIDFLTQFKAKKRHKDVPFIMCTTVDDIAKILEAVKLGADEYLVKPWKKEELKSKIDFLLSRSKSKLS